MKNTLIAASICLFALAACGPDEALEDGIEPEATVDDSPSSDDLAESQAELIACSTWGAWARYPNYGACGCGRTTAWGSTASATNRAVSGWTAGTPRAGRSRRVQAKCSRSIDGRTVTATSAWSTSASNIFVGCPSSYPNLVAGRCMVR